MGHTVINTRSEKEFVEKGVSYVKEIMETAIADHDSFIIALSGGSTPRPVYEELGKQDVDWKKVTVLLLDERHIDPDDERSNQKLIRETLLQHAAIPEENLIFPDTKLSTKKCVEHYNNAVRDMFATSDYLPDLAVLGMGEDGHIASLFPPLSDLALGDRCYALHTETDRFDVHDRISLALNVIGAAQNHLFLLKGEGKKKVWEEMLASDEDERRWPAKRMLDPRGSSAVITLW